MAKRGGADMMGGSPRGDTPNVGGGGGDRSTKRKPKPEMSKTSWRQLSPQERGNFFGGVRPGSVKKKVLTKSQRAQRESEGR